MRSGFCIPLFGSDGSLFCLSFVSVVAGLLAIVPSAIQGQDATNQPGAVAESATPGESPSESDTGTSGESQGKSEDTPKDESAENSKSESRDPAELAEDISSFDFVWQTINDKQWDPEFDSAAWSRVREELRPRVLESSSRSETRRVINEMIESLELSHYAVIPAELYQKMERVERPKNSAASDDGDEDSSKADEDEDEESDEEDIPGESGMRARFFDDKLLIVAVEPGSAADKAGIRTGWRITKIDTRDLEELLQEMQEELSEAGPNRIETLIALTAEALLDGDKGDEVSVVCRDAAGEEHAFEFVLQEAAGNSVSFGHLPEMHVKTKVQTLEHGIGYVTFNVFFDPVNVMNAVKTAVSIARDGSGLVLDLRGNLGGLGAMTMGVGNMFVEEKNFLGTMHLAGGADLKFVLVPRAKPFLGPVAVLVDECSISSAEILAGGLQAIGRARLFGNRTAGMALPSNVELLPNGDRFQYVFAGYEDSQGRKIEGAGVTPDEFVPLSQETLLKESDPVLSAAIAWILEQQDSQQSAASAGGSTAIP